VAVFASVLQLVSGHASGVEVAKYQPAKLAAYEGVYAADAPAPMHLFGWVNEKNEKVEFGVALPGMLSWLVHGNTTTPVKGLDAFKPEDRPPVNLVFQTYHAMVAIGMALIGISLLGVFFWWRRTLFDKRWFLKILVVAVVLPELANQLGWMSAEVGRQPWIVYGLLRTRDALSPVVTAGQTLTSLILFTLIYLLLFALFIYLLDHKIKEGPVDADMLGEGHRA
jgi:cytochrome d ubiquinol oxidase subunit I